MCICIILLHISLIPIILHYILEFIGFALSQSPTHLAGEPVSNHDELMSNFFAQPDALAYGKTNKTKVLQSVFSISNKHSIYKHSIDKHSINKYTTLILYTIQYTLLLLLCHR